MSRTHQRFGSTICIVAALAWVCAGAARTAEAADNEPANHVAVALYQLDPDVFQFSWAATILSRLSFVNGVTSVTVQLPDGTSVPLSQDSDELDEWGMTVPFADFAAMLASTHGTWSFIVNGAEPSTTEFTLSVDTLVPDDFFDPPVMLSPADGSTVPVSTDFAWMDPTGADVPDAVAIEANADTGCVAGNTLDGDFAIDATAWDAPPFDPGQFYTAGLFYLNYAAEATSTYQVVGGSIAWSDAVGVPGDYPALTPRFTIGSATVNGFFTGAGAPGDVNGDGVVNTVDLLALIGSWGACPGCPEDLDGDGVVGITDLLLLVANWT